MTYMVQELMATVISVGCSMDVELSRQEDDLFQGACVTTQSPRTRVQMRLRGWGTDQCRLRIRLVSEGTVLSDLTARPEPETRNFVRFEFQMPDKVFPLATKNPFVDRNSLTVQVDEQVELKRLFKNTDEGLSYMPFLRHFLKWNEKPSVLEWGAGRSTLLIPEWAPKAKLLSIEHQAMWYEQCKKACAGRPNVEMAFEPLTLRPGESGAYVTLPLLKQQKYDVIFIDGRMRCDCLAVAKLVLAPKGVVILHDTRRTNYRRGVLLFDKRQMIGQTAILSTE